MTEPAVAFLIAVASLLALASVGGKVARALEAPAVVGEIVAGVLLGPTVLGRISPHLQETLFPALGFGASALEAFRLVGLVLLVFMAGLEIDLAQIRRLARPALLTATGSLVVPFAAGLGLAFLAPTFLEAPPLVPRGAFALLMGTVLAISALPVLARILMDLSLLGSEIGTLCLAAAMLDDVIGWLALSLAIGWSQPGTSSSVALTAAGTLGFAAVVIAARPLLDRVAARAGLAPLLVLALLGGAATHHLGTHAAIGSFLVGIAIRTEHLPEEVRRSVERFVTSFFSPILFAAIGLRVDYAASFSLPLTLLIITIATITKLAGAGGGALVAGYPRRFAFAAAAGLNARGAMGVVLSEVALDRGLIGRPLFVALVSMALVTSLASGPLLARFARR